MPKGVYPRAGKEPRARFRKPKSVSHQIKELLRDWPVEQLQDAKLVRSFVEEQDFRPSAWKGNLAKIAREVIAEKTGNEEVVPANGKVYLTELQCIDRVLKVTYQVGGLERLKRFVSIIERIKK